MRDRNCWRRLSARATATTGSRASSKTLPFTTLDSAASSAHRSGSLLPLLRGAECNFFQEEFESNPRRNAATLCFAPRLRATNDLAEKEQEDQGRSEGFPSRFKVEDVGEAPNQMLCKSPHRCCKLAPVTRSRTCIEHFNNIDEHFCTRLQLTEQIPIFGVYRLLSVWEEDYRPKGQTPQLAECTGDLAPMKSTWKRKG